MLDYPVRLEPDGDSILVTSPDFPELATFGNDREDALGHAADALEEAIAARMRGGEDVPEPSEGDVYAIVPTLTAVKALLYRTMRSQGVGKAELARRLGWHTPRVDRVLDVRHRSRMDQMDAALGALGARLRVSAAFQETIA